MSKGPIEKILESLDELGKIIKAQEVVIAEKNRRIEEMKFTIDSLDADIAAQHLTAKGDD